MSAPFGRTFNKKFYKEQYELNNNNLIETIYNKKTFVTMFFKDGR